MEEGVGAQRFKRPKPRGRVLPCKMRTNSPGADEAVSTMSIIAFSFIFALAAGVLRFTRLASRHRGLLTRSFCLSMIISVVLLTAGMLGARPPME